MTDTRREGRERGRERDREREGEKEKAREEEKSGRWVIIHVITYVSLPEDKTPSYATFCEYHFFVYFRLLSNRACCVKRSALYDY